ncbi:hypothetical protein HF324_31620 [Chitinophaga oryzae]|uniref:Uncharacterized protein n=1 Tax=Chitinophaga oryzae TaxID=2725414 RepID=A0AAE6ZPH4_9BACT|nr:hypothetical protein [Chitinophaga oryzae]QJB35605.1 hypothetical protein HF329_31600 [Chitinophaga oryzae]QJB42147.1 hypothetical protein HF324_31620 [Chitinophaga oryzae]
MKNKANNKGPATLLIVASLLLILLISGIPSTRRISKTSCKPVTGQVAEVTKSTPGYVVHLKDDPRIYYIKPAAFPSATTTSLSRQLQGRPVQLFTADAWSPLDPFSSMKEIRRLQIGDTVIFSDY